MVSKSAANRDRLAAGQWTYRRWWARPAGKVRPAWSGRRSCGRRCRPCRGAPAWSRAARPRRTSAGWPEPFRELGPPGITAARQPRETPLRHPPRIGDRRRHRPPARPRHQPVRLTPAAVPPRSPAGTQSC